MKVVTGVSLFYQQYKALFKKNLILAKRHKKFTLVQLFFSFFFFTILFGVDRTLGGHMEETYAASKIVDPKRRVLSILPCELKFGIKKPCFDFVWSGNGNPIIQKIVNAIGDRNPRRQISPNKIKGFNTTDDVDAWLYNNPMKCPAALHVVMINATTISYGIQIDTNNFERYGMIEDILFNFQLPLQIGAEREIARFLLGEPKFSWTVGLKEYAHPETIPKPNSASSLTSQFGPIFFLAIAMFGFVFQTTSLIAEKELKLRQTMSIMGLTESAYWLSWFTWEGLITLFQSLISVFVGKWYRFDVFFKSSFAVMFLVFFFFQLNLVGFAFMLSAFVSKSSSSIRLGFSVFLVSIVTQILENIGYPYDLDRSKIEIFFWSFFPPNLFNRAMHILDRASVTPESDEISWSKQIPECQPGRQHCEMKIIDVYKWLTGTVVLWYFLAIYLDNILKDESGVRKPVFYFLNSGYWTGKESDIWRQKLSYPPLEPNTHADKDVIEEENIIKQQTMEGEVDPEVAVQIRGLVKEYPGSWMCVCKCRCSCCFKFKRTSPCIAVKDIWMNFLKDQLFCLLGPNGAGKTTVISCLTGMTSVTHGDAVIYGDSIQSSIGMSNIRQILGFCPQLDILWDVLSGIEHLNLFAAIKGIPPDLIDLVSQMSLGEVKLSEAAKMRTSTYSAGMKRRLSFAIALIGDPKLLILDEPTSGMDPITRRYIWDLIKNSKRGRAIILATHSMEEADILSDRIAIMAKGRLRCIGSSFQLKSKFGAGFITNVSFNESIDGKTPPNGAVDPAIQQETLKQFFKQHLDVKPAEERKSFLTFVIPHDREARLPDFFAELQHRIKEFGIEDIQLGLTTLEEVFSNIARQAEVENAIIEGRMVTITSSSGVSVQVPINARFVGIPGTESVENPRGVMVEVYWEEDEFDEPWMAGHSDELPIPPDAQKMASSAETSDCVFLGHTGPVPGIVIDPAYLKKED